MSTYETPDEPDNPVLDCDGDLWRRDNQGWWRLTSNDSDLAEMWEELVSKYGPLTDAPSNPVEEARQRLVTAGFANHHLSFELYPEWWLDVRTLLNG